MLSSPNKEGDFLVIDASATSTALGFLPDSVMKVKMEPRDFLFGMMQLLDPFIYFFGAVHQWYAMPIEKSNRTRASFVILFFSFTRTMRVRVTQAKQVEVDYSVTIVENGCVDILEPLGTPPMWQQNYGHYGMALICVDLNLPNVLIELDAKLMVELLQKDEGSFNSNDTIMVDCKAGLQKI
nr:hypothetical protein CFP56_02293 [Quercus suber]